MGRTHTSSAVKDRYNKKAYDSIMFRLPKGERDKIKAVAAEAGESLAGYIRKAIDMRIKDERVS